MDWGKHYENVSPAPVNDSAGPPAHFSCLGFFKQNPKQTKRNITSSTFQRI